MKISPNSKFRRSLPWISAAFFLLSCSGYTHLWFKQARWLEERINHEISLLQRSKETNLEHEGVKITGFPWKLEIKIRNPRLTLTRGGAGLFQIDGQLEVESTVWSPKTIVVNALGKTKLIYTPVPQLAPLMIEFEDFQGSFKIHHKDYIFNTLKIYDLHLKMLENRVNIEEVSLSMLPQKQAFYPPLSDATTPPLKEPSTLKPTPFTSFAFKLYRMNVNDHRTMKFPSLLKSLEAVIHFDETFNLFSATPLKEWAEKGSFLEIERLAFEWGSLKGEGNGTFALDHELQPLAAFSIKILGLESLLDQLAKEKIIRKNVASIAKLSLGLLQDKSTAHDEPPRHTIALSLQKGDLSIGPLTIAKLPRIKWPSR
jgi:hypothetical protein